MTNENRAMTSIKLAGGRGIVCGNVVHMNPNYWYVIDATGTGITVPVDLIESADKES
jgi:hypothetical protein